MLIFNGNKLRAFNQVLCIKQGLKHREMNDPFLIFLVAMMKITPDIMFSSIKLGGASYNVPLPITENQRVVFSVK
jgi:ribosomal protein S7